MPYAYQYFFITGISLANFWTVLNILQSENQLFLLKDFTVFELDYTLGEEASFGDVMSDH